MKRWSSIAVGILVLITFVLIITGSLIVIIPKGYAGMMFDSLNSSNKIVLKEGVYLIVPFIQRVIIYNPKNKKRTETPSYSVHSFSAFSPYTQNNVDLDQSSKEVSKE